MKYNLGYQMSWTQRCLHHRDLEHQYIVMTTWVFGIIRCGPKQRSEVHLTNLILQSTVWNGTTLGLKCYSTAKATKWRLHSRSITFSGCASKQPDRMLKWSQILTIIWWRGGRGEGGGRGRRRKGGEVRTLQLRSCVRRMFRAARSLCTKDFRAR